MKRVLVLGGTGAMGVYLVPELSKKGHKVDVISLDDVKSNDTNVTYIKANAMDDEYLAELLKTKYDGIVDFMIYSIPQFKKRHPMFTANGGHYIFFATYRVYADDKPITENSPRLLDVSKDKEFLSTLETEYSLYKAAQEDIVRAGSFKNWTIVRPAITYSKRRFQLITLEANVVVWRALNHKKVMLPKEAENVEATMSWGGDVGKMLCGILFNENAVGETFTLATSEHHTWGEIAEYYHKLIGLEYEFVDSETYLRHIVDDNGYNAAKYQLIYDRLFDRVVDNSKILNTVGMKQEELMTLKEGLKKELADVTADTFKPAEYANRKMDEYFA